MTTVLVTGASGFIGSALCTNLSLRGNRVIGIVRKKTFSGHAICINDIVGFADWPKVLEGVEVVVHLAGRAHILKDQTLDPLEDFRRVNTRATISLAENAAAAGVKRFIFISSIGVNGGVTHDKPFSVDDIPRPHSPYAYSKYEAELALQDISYRTGIEIVVIRPPLVYGPNAPGNFRSLMRWLASGVPLPLGAITRNLRSFVGLDNLVDLISVCVDHPSAHKQVLMVSDGEDISTAELLRRLGSMMEKPARLITIPVSWLTFGAKLLGKREMFQSLCSSLQVDISNTCTLLNWKPPVSVEEGLRRAVQQRL